MGLHPNTPGAHIKATTNIFLHLWIPQIHYLRSDSSHLCETPKTFHQASIFIIYFMQQTIQTQRDFSAFYSEYYVE